MEFAEMEDGQSWRAQTVTAAHLSEISSTVPWVHEMTGQLLWGGSPGGGKGAPVLNAGRWRVRGAGNGDGEYCSDSRLCCPADDLGDVTAAGRLNHATGSAVARADKTIYGIHCRMPVFGR